jgi:alkanesulfonate monooxygenase SsuD/methylene tetrahydromethanopterin reductase-like flavin-dependent oxidoreductase (luciferase family)
MTACARIGAVFPTGLAIEGLPGYARRVESLGYDELWVVEDCFAYGGLTAAATALAGTSRLAVGIGLLPAAVRNAAIVAMEIATLATIHPHRLRVAIGHGVESWMTQIGARPPDRIVALREVVTAVRGLLHGERVSVAGGHVSLLDVVLEQPPAVVPPVLVGTTGPRGIEVAARGADGLLLPEGAGESAIAAARAALPAGADLVVYAWLRVDEDEAAARACLLPAVDAWRRRDMYRHLIEQSTVSSSGPVDAAMLDDVTVAGGRQRCAAAVTRRQRAGASAVVLMPGGDDGLGQLETFAGEVLPLLLAEPS